MEIEFKPFERDDVVLSLGPVMMKSKKFMSLVSTAFGNSGTNNLKELCTQNGHGNLPNHGSNWVSEEGIKCEILDPSIATWQKGKLRLKILLEFCPDEVEVSSLDKLRT